LPSVRELIPADYAGVVVTDRGPSYEAEELLGVKQQKCLDHLNRNINEVLESKTGRARGFGFRWVFAIGFRPVLCGLAAGLFAAIMIGQAVRGLLYGNTPTDPVSLGLVALILLLTAALACYVPARRAARLDPMIALRHE
jgi:hypothetical protein